LAVTDPVTGFCSARYFLLLMNQKLRSRESLSFAALRVANYTRLTIQMEFEQGGSLMGLLAGRLKARAEKHFKRFILSRLYGDTLAIAVEGASKEETESFLAPLAGRIDGLDGDLGEKDLEVSLQGCVIHKGKALAAGVP